jgi:hypothetical protein
VRQTSKGLEIPNPPGLPQPSMAVPRIPTTGLSGRYVRDMGPSDGGTNMMVGVLTWKVDSSTDQQIVCCVLKLAESNYSVLSWEDVRLMQDCRGRPALMRSVASLERKVERACRRGKERSRVSLIIGLITSQSTRRDQGCVLVCENLGLVKQEEFVVLVV